MFKTRLLTTLVLAPLVLAAILYLPAIGIALLASVVSLAALWELSHVLGYDWLESRLLLLVSLGAVQYWSFDHRADCQAYIILLILGLLWLFNLIILLSGRIKPPPADRYRLFFLLQGWLALWGFWLALVHLETAAQGRAWLILFLLLIWSADIGAYLTGKTWGRHKLAPMISPGKTVEGALGALASAVLISILAAPFFNQSIGLLILVSLATVAVSIGGDLWESLIKRSRGVKDSGQLIPGHGGLLDRIDSQIAAAPFFVALLAYMGWI